MNKQYKIVDGVAVNTGIGWPALRYAEDSALAVFEDVATRSEYEADLPREYA